MKRKKYAIPASLMCLMSAMAAVPAATAQEQETPSAAELVTEYLQRDIFLKPGVGLDAVKIGMAFERVREAWGPPAEEGRDNLINTRWTYEIAGHTTITLIGNDDVEIMRVAGGFNSPYVTAEGASFGMARHQLATIYGAAEAEDGKVRYGERGIGFVLKRGQVSEIRVFPPKQ